MVDAPMVSALDARVLRATDQFRERSPAEIGQLAGCAPDVALSSLRRLRGRMLVEDDGERPQRWLRTPSRRRRARARARVKRRSLARPDGVRESTPLV
jgi:hypothetical protein